VGGIGLGYLMASRQVIAAACVANVSAREIVNVQTVNSKAL